MAAHPGRLGMFLGNRPSGKRTVTRTIGNGMRLSFAMRTRT